MGKKISKNVKNVLAILGDEIRGDVSSAYRKLTADYRMTWMYKSKNGVLFPRTGKNLKKEMKEVYVIKDRKYDIKNIAEGDNLVMVEMVESYPDPKTKKVYRTPIVIVLEMKNGKIRRGRHYCDPAISYLYLSKKQIQAGYR
ncbi:MAG: nuclear transport factor 2 family protein [Candidatus Parcubacteria bacterium]|nr:nuclear transport factor 2 family protein [Candidatus Parcubacteria bacterium]